MELLRPYCNLRMCFLFWGQIRRFKMFKNAKLPGYSTEESGRPRPRFKGLPNI